MEDVWADSEEGLAIFTIFDRCFELFERGNQHKDNIACSPMTHYLNTNFLLDVLTCGPSPLYIHVTILSSKLMSSFWLKSRSLAASSGYEEFITTGGIYRIFP